MFALQDNSKFDGQESKCSAFFFLKNIGTYVVY